MFTFRRLILPHKYMKENNNFYFLKNVIPLNSEIPWKSTKKKSVIKKNQYLVWFPILENKGRILNEHFFILPQKH